MMRSTGPSAMHAVDRRGIPAVSAHLDFKSPGRLGDQLDWTLRVSRLGRSSATMMHQAMIAATEILSGTTTIVHTHLDKMGALAWTDDVRGALAAYVNEGEAG